MAVVSWLRLPAFGLRPEQLSVPGKIVEGQVSPATGIPVDNLKIDGLSLQSADVPCCSLHLRPFWATSFEQDFLRLHVDQTHIERLWIEATRCKKTGACSVNDKLGRLKYDLLFVGESIDFGDRREMKLTLVMERPAFVTRQ